MGHFRGMCEGCREGMRWAGAWCHWAVSIPACLSGNPGAEALSFSTTLPWLYPGMINGVQRITLESKELGGQGGTLKENDKTQYFTCVLLLSSFNTDAILHVLCIEKRKTIHWHLSSYDCKVLGQKLTSLEGGSWGRLVGCPVLCTCKPSQQPLGEGTLPSPFCPRVQHCSGPCNILQPETKTFLKALMSARAYRSTSSFPVQWAKSGRHQPLGSTSL